MNDIHKYTKSSYNKSAKQVETNWKCSYEKTETEMFIKIANECVKWGRLRLQIVVRLVHKCGLYKWCKCAHIML